MTFRGRAESSLWRGQTSLMRSLTYADDISFVIASLMKMRLLLETIEEAEEWEGLSFNPKHCATFTLKRNGSKCQALPTVFGIQQEQLQALNEGEGYKYLSVSQLGLVGVKPRLLPSTR